MVMRAIKMLLKKKKEKSENMVIKDLKNFPCMKNKRK